MSQPVNHCVGLLASEMATRGGIQSFMFRVAEVIERLRLEKRISHGYCISLNDSSVSLREHPSMPSGLTVWGGGRSKLALIWHMLSSGKRADVLFVGHVGLGPVARVLKALGKIKAYYIILHGIEVWRRVSWEDRIGLMGADCLIATTQYTADECARLNGIPLDKFRVTPLCADVRVETGDAHFKLSGGFKLLCVARQSVSERLKGFDHIIEAVSVLREECPDIHLSMIGKGDDQDRLKELSAKLGVSNQISFLGGVGDEELVAAYQDCDVFVMPSKKEGFGIVFLEAMRFGKPCIGGNHGGTPDVISHGESGFLVEYGDVAALVAHIRTLYMDRDKSRRMGVAGRAMVDGKFSPEAFFRSYMAYATVVQIND